MITINITIIIISIIIIIMSSSSSSSSSGRRIVADQYDSRDAGTDFLLVCMCHG